jgi:hypothetical protein
MSVMNKSLLVASLFLLAGLNAASAADTDLAAGFANPPDSAKPWAYWWWLDSFATPAGITRDLEEMKRQGISGVLLFDAGEGGPDAPKGPLFMSAAWRELFKHALREAARLQMEVGVNLCSGWDAGGAWVTPEHAAKQLVWSETRVRGPAAIDQVLPTPPTRENFYREIAVLAFPDKIRATEPRPSGSATISEPVKTSGKIAPKPLKDWELKAARRFLTGPAEMLHEEEPSTPGEQDYERPQLVDLTQRVDASGRLNWNAPAGAWTLLRFGYTLLGAKTKCTSPGAQGLEIDFFSSQAMDFHFAETAEKMIADAGPLAGKTLKYLHDDSYEVVSPDGIQPTWTPEFRAEFLARRGYDPLPCLPALAGRIVDSRELANRFLWDYRRTIGDLFAANHYRRMRDLAQRHGLGTHPESGGPFWLQIDALECEGINDIPMGEFWKRAPEPNGTIAWSNTYPICDTVRQAASAAHIYGKPLCQAEAFTSMGPNWEEDLFDLKDIGDRAFCAGLTRNVLCFYVHQGRLDAKPGYQWEAAGTHFDRNVTWWDQGRAWLAYLARCQYLLQQGLFAADVCYFYGEDVPNFVPAKTHMRPALPAGYDCDTINADALLRRLSARDGRLVLPDGLSYRVLVLPERRAMSPRVLRKIKDLVAAGATILGPKPERAPGLTDYPQCDDEVKKLANELWGTMPNHATEPRPSGSVATSEPANTSAKINKFGRGQIIWGKSLAEVLASLGAPPDFEAHSDAPGATLEFIHRQLPDGDLYFVSNQQNRPEKADCVFRVRGRQPEIWDAVTGERWPATDFRLAGERTVVPLEFAPRQSWFVVFRPSANLPHANRRNFPALATIGELAGPWTVKFDPKWGGPASVSFERLQDWTHRPEPGIRYYSGKAAYARTFDLPEAARAPGQRLHLDLGKVKNLAEVRLNGRPLGVVWTAPWRIEITPAVQATGNRLEIDVVNLWPNRLIGDAALPPDKRLTTTNVKKFEPNTPLLESGLLGPVTLRMEELK